MNRVEEIKLFLNLMLNLSKTKEITELDVYYHLSKYKINNQNSNNINFNDWLNYFNNKRNINVYIKKEYPFFCNFTNIDTNKNNFNYIKLSISLDSEHLDLSVKQLFSYLEENNIKHSSKVSKNDISNNITIRVRSKEDADKISKYISNNNYIKECMREVNPFSYSINNIAYESDGLLSYNKILSEIIASYINHINKSNIYNEASLQSFRLFLNEIYQNYFINKREINKLKDEFKSNLILNNKFKNEHEYVANYMEVVELIISSMNPNNNIDNFYNHYNNICSKDIKNKRINSIKNNNSNIEKLVKKIVIEMIKKNGLFLTTKRLEKYISSKNNLFLNKKVRKLIIEKENELINYLKDEDIEELVNNIKDNKLKERKNKKEECLIYVSKLTYKKYVETEKNINQLIYALMNLKNNDFSGFTNENGARQILSLYIKPEEVDDIIKNILTLNDYELNEESNIYELFNDFIKISLDKSIDKGKKNR